MSELGMFNRDLVQDVLATAEASDTTLPDAFTQRMIEHLTEAGQVEDGLVCYHRARGIEVSGYGPSDDGSTLDLFVTNFRNDVASPTMTATEVTTLFRRLDTFVERCRGGYTASVDDSSPVYDMVQDIQIVLKSATQVRLHVLTNATVRPQRIASRAVGDVEHHYDVWDLGRLHRLLTSGSLHEPIVVDFTHDFGVGLRCLSTPSTDDDYSVLLAIVPGTVLAALYNEHGPRLLELNVRSFLQAKGSVNRGIRETLLRTPERFLAYNNGISATASRVELTDDGQSIARLHDLQIVNGGQTTASVAHASKTAGTDLDDVFVQAKITVVSPDKIDQIVPQISRFSNTQNKVTTADFSSNDPFHVAVEKLSRSVWAPSKSGDGQETRWFYERARGQYADELGRMRTPARQAAFRLSHPTRQKFTKTDLAKFEATWDGLPHVVSRGAEKNFREFMIGLSSRQRPAVDQTYFQRLVAKALLFKETERIVSARNFGGYRANIVTYTVAKLVKACQSRVDLDEVWSRQAISPALSRALDDLSPLVQRSLTSPPTGANIGEWCKRAEAWSRVDAIEWNPPTDLRAEFVSPRAGRIRTAVGSDGSDTTDSVEVTRAAAVSPQTWIDCASWAKQTNRLAPWQRGLAFSLGQRAHRREPPSQRQAVQGLMLLQEATRLGFVPEESLPAGVA